MGIKKYWVFKQFSDSEDVFLSGLPGTGPEDYEYLLGKPLADSHPSKEQAGMYYDPEHSEGVRLNNFVDNLNDVLIGDEKVESVLKTLGVDNVEYLPVQLYDHQDKLVAENYSVINILGAVDIFDMEKSDVTMGSLIKDQIADVDEMVVDYEAIPENALIFRASRMLKQVFIRDDVKLAFEKAELTGFECFEAEGWDG